MNQQERNDAQRANQDARKQYVADLLANRIPASGLDGIESVGTSKSPHQRWSEDDVARFATMIYDWPEDAIDRGLYWNDAMEATAMLMASLYILAREMHNHHDQCDGSTWPGMVRHIVTTTLAKAPLLRAKVIEALLF